mmetsp:Transcript_5697/g.21505  ORF Transcript_5697/g.21505 Transcript_5697/m.21505 type:complete len:236 (-) Transcript_5697:270-977(-)
MSTLHTLFQHSLLNFQWKFLAGLLAVLVLLNENSPHLTEILTMTDVGFVLATPIYKILKESPVLLWWILLVDTLYVFACGFFVIYLFIVKNRIHFGMQVVSMYVVRSCAMRLYELPVPDEVLWHFPGFPHHVCSDFFFSGHVALAVMTGVQLWDMDWKKLGILVGFVLNLLQIILFLGTRAHYSADCITGFACGIAIVCGWKFFGFSDEPITDEGKQLYNAPKEVRKRKPLAKLE